MNKEWKQQANIAGAKVIGLSVGFAEMQISTGWTIFGDSDQAASNRDRVVQALWDRYHIFIACEDDGWLWENAYGKQNEPSGVFCLSTREEAIGHACIAVVGGE